MTYRVGGGATTTGKGVCEIDDWTGNGASLLERHKGSGFRHRVIYSHAPLLPAL